MSNPDPRITIADIRQSGHCVAGARRWFERMGINFAVFLREGIPESELLATGDVLAQEVVRKTRERRVNGKV